MIKLITLIKETSWQRSDKERINLLQQWLDNKIKNAPGNTRYEKTTWLWKNDKNYGKVAKILLSLDKQFHEKNLQKLQSDKTSIEQYYVRFGDIPQSGKSWNSLLSKNEQGLSVYHVIWDTKINKWLLKTEELSTIGISTLDSLIYDFLEDKGRPIYLIQGYELKDVGIHDLEPLLDINQIKIIKKLQPNELFIEGYDDEWFKGEYD